MTCSLAFGNHLVWHLFAGTCGGPLSLRRLAALALSSYGDLGDVQTETSDWFLYVFAMLNHVEWKKTCSFRDFSIASKLKPPFSFVSAVELFLFGHVQNFGGLLSMRHRVAPIQ